ncbi:uncharacterized protein VTP21DRAFT_10783 [Calcarisporiella thermophila]|uniref:uncharacterized protein n=1 Tax=Calcarisporiella thermophila TaxID=911321 RepID=UPI003742D56A
MVHSQEEVYPGGKSASLISSPKLPILPPRSTRYIYAEEGITTPFWVNHLLTVHKLGPVPHVHEFLYPSPELAEYLNTLLAASETSGETLIVICGSCRQWFHVNTHSQMDTRRCSSESEIHHFHPAQAQGQENEKAVWRCCECYFRVEVDVHAPQIPLSVFQALERTRPVDSFSTRVGSGNSGVDRKTTLNLALETISRYVRNALEGDDRAIPITGNAFKQRVGLDEGSRACFEALGYEIGESAISPPAKSLPDREPIMKRGYLDLSLALHVAREQMGNVSAGRELFQKAEPVLNAHVVNAYARHWIASSSVPTSGLKAALNSLGVMSDMSDDLIKWAYHKAVEHVPGKTPEYLDALTEIANERQAMTLQEEVAILKSQGIVSGSDIKSAYERLGVESGAEDLEVVQAYKEKANWEIGGELKDALRIIASARSSQVIWRFLDLGELSQEFEAGAGGDLGRDIEMIDHSRGELPAGLENVGNTCYLNSLLQYYFTIRGFREAVMRMDEHVEEESLVGKKIYGREISRQEVKLAKKFVGLLSELFVTMIYSRQRSVTPNLELARMALEKPPISREEGSRGCIDELSQMKGEDNVNLVESEAAQVMEVDKTEGVGMKGPERPLPQEMILGSQKAAGKDFATGDLVISSKDKMSTGEAWEASDLAPLLGYSAPASSSDKAATVTNTATTAAASNMSTSIPTHHTDMTFGVQQDVTECMDNVMCLIEAALKPTSAGADGERQNIVRELFFGKTKQLLSYIDTKSGEPVCRAKEEAFIHLFVDAREGYDLYDGLDAYFGPAKVEVEGTEATREVYISQLPPVLQIQIQRVQFDRSTSNAYKSNAFLRFDKVVYMDRYLAENRDRLADRHREVLGWRQELEHCQKLVGEYTKNKTYPLPVPDMLSAAIAILREELATYTDTARRLEVEQVINGLVEEENRAREKLTQAQKRIEELIPKLKGQFSDLREHAYRAHAVFMHQGGVEFGHYWIYIHDFERDRWLKYDDASVTEVSEQEVFTDSGTTANPYMIVYVREEDSKELVDTVCRRLET